MALLVYIASQYTIGDKMQNVERQIEAANQVLDCGCVPVWPLSSHWLDQAQPRSWQHWMRVDLELVRRCDVLIRLPGDSRGADMEVEEARRHGLLVLESTAELREWLLQGGS